MFNTLFHKVSLNLYAVLPFLAFLLGLITAFILLFFFLASRKKIFLHLTLLFLFFSVYQYAVGCFLHVTSPGHALLCDRFLFLSMLLHVPLFYQWTYYFLEKKRDNVFWFILASSALFFILGQSPLMARSIHLRFNYFRPELSPFILAFLVFYFGSIIYAVLLAKRNFSSISSNILFPNIMRHFFFRTGLILLLLITDQLNLQGLANIPPLSSAGCIAASLIIIFSIFKSYVLYYEMLKKNYLQTITGLAELLDNKDNYTYRHSYRVTRYAVTLARLLKLDEETVSCIKKASLLHDIGKIGIPDDILLKKEKLTNEEWELIKTHAEEGATILNIVDFLKKEADIIRHHHERYDGTGYPDRLPFDKIPVEAQVISMVDTFDAMTSRRPYRGKYSFREVFREFQRVKGKQFAPDLVDRFLSHWDEMMGLYKKLERQIKKS